MDKFRRSLIDQEFWAETSFDLEFSTNARLLCQDKCTHSQFRLTLSALMCSYVISYMSFPWFVNHHFAIESVRLCQIRTDRVYSDSLIIGFQSTLEQWHMLISHMKSVYIINSHYCPPIIETGSRPSKVLLRSIFEGGKGFRGLPLSR